MYVLFVLTTYILHSILEWMAHVWMDEYEIKHKKHHKNHAIDDTGMYLNILNPKLLLLYLLPSYLYIQIFHSYFPKTNMLLLFIIDFCLLLYSITIWNTFHGFMHGYDCKNAPMDSTSGLCLGNDAAKKLIHVFPWIQTFIIDHHMTHHKKGTCNYTTSLPFADHLFGTYLKKDRD